MSRGGARRQSLFAGRKITRGALYLLVAEVTVSLVILLLSKENRYEVLQWIGASTDTVWREWHVWALVTSPVVQPHFIALIFHGLILWLFVPTLERWWGTRRFLLFAAYTSVLATTVGTLAGLAFGDGGAVMGLDAFIYASIIAFGVLYADHPVQFFGVLPMTGKQLMIGISAFMLLFIAIAQEWSRGAADVAAMVLAWGIASGKWNPRLWWLKWRQKRIRKHLKLVRDDDEPEKWVN